MFLFLAEENLKEQVDKSFNLPPIYETIVSRAQLAAVSFSDTIFNTEGILLQLNERNQYLFMVVFKGLSPLHESCISNTFLVPCLVIMEMISNG